MTITLKNGRQTPLCAEVAFGFADLPTAVSVKAFNLPANAQIVGGAIIVDTAWDTGTTATVNVGDSVTANRYGSAVNLKAAARTPLTLTGFINGAGLDLNLTSALVGTAATVGGGRIQIMYVIQDRATEVQPN